MDAGGSSGIDYPKRCTYKGLDPEKKGGYFYAQKHKSKHLAKSDTR